MIQQLCSMKQKTQIHTNTNKSTHSEMGPVRQNPIQRTVRTAHLNVPSVQVSWWSFGLGQNWKKTGFGRPLVNWCWTFAQSSIYAWKRRQCRCGQQQAPHQWTSWTPSYINTNNTLYTLKKHWRITRKQILSTAVQQHMHGFSSFSQDDWSVPNVSLSQGNC